MLKFEAKKGDFAKIWQKLGGYSPPSPPGSAAMIAKPFMWEKQSELNIRAKEHIAVIKSGSERSHTAEDCWKYKHEFDWERKKVLDFEQS